MCSSEHDDRLGSLEVLAVTVMGNLRSTERLGTSRTDRVGDRGTPEVEGQTKSQMFKRDRVRRRIWKRRTAAEEERQPQVSPSGTVATLRAQSDDR